MIKLEISVKPKNEKYLEFSQSLSFIKNDLEKLCNSVMISEKDRVFSIIADLDSVEHLTTVLHSNEICILSGAIRMLGKKSGITISGIGHKEKGSDLVEIRLNYPKIKKEKLNTKLT